jgi:membrane fusion protein
VLTYAALATALATLAYGFWGEYTRKEHVVGYLVPDKGIIKVFSQQSGTVRAVRIQEAAAVNVGDVLFIVSSEHHTGVSGSTEATTLELLNQRRENLLRERDRQRSIARIEQVDGHGRIISLTAELSELAQQWEIQQQIVETSQRLARRFTELGTEKFVSTIQIQQQVDSSLQQQAKLREINRLRIASQRELDTLQGSLRASQLRSETAQSTIERDIREIEQGIAEYLSRTDLAITAPVSGTVTGILAKPGQLANAGAPLVSILPSGARLEAQLLVPTRAAGFVRPGQSVSLRYRAFPYQRFGSHRGEVRQVDKTIITASDIALPVPIDEPVYRVTVRLKEEDVLAYGERIPLQSGMLLDGDIAIDKRRLIEWLLAPIYNITGKI